MRTLLMMMMMMILSLLNYLREAEKFYQYFARLKKQSVFITNS